MKTEFLKVNDSVDILPAEVNATVRQAFTIVKIVDAEGIDVKALVNGLGENQCFLTGQNLLDDPRFKGKFDPKKVYVFET